jgi:hypothetical protein
MPVLYKWMADGLLGIEKLPFPEHFALLHFPLWTNLKSTNTKNKSHFIIKLSSHHHDFPGKFLC